MKKFLALAVLSVVAAAAKPAAAGAPPVGFGRSPAAIARPLPPRDGPQVRRSGHSHHHRHGGFRVVASAPAYGSLPPFFAGTGDAADYLYGAPVRLTVYREAYIGRGLIYNTPPTLDVPGPRPVLSARY